MTTIATTDEKPSLAQLITRMQPEIAKALPKHMNPDRMARIATTTLRQTPALARTTPESFLGALLTASQLGLEPGPTGEAYFVPYKQTCTFIPGYRGLIKLARQSGQVSDIYAELVYENDFYEVTLGLNRDIKHEVRDRNNRGKPTDVYAVAKFKDGTNTFVTMTVAEVEAIRKRSMAANNGPWVTDWPAMARKTAVRQLAKWLPLSPEFNSAVALDGSARTDIGPLVDAQTEFVDGEVVDGPAAITEAAPEPSDTTESTDTPPSDSPAEVVMASRQQLGQLKQIWAQEKYENPDERAAYLRDVFGFNVSADKDLTFDQAAQVISTFNEEASK